jgi:hypothetical protein
MGAGSIDSVKNAVFSLILQLYLRWIVLLRA